MLETAPAAAIFSLVAPPIANLLLTVLDKVGAPVQKLGDSTGLIQPDYLSV